MGKKRGFFRGIAKCIETPVKFIGKLPRETFRIIDQGLDIANTAIEKTGLNKVLSGGGSIGVSTSSGSHGGSNVHYTPSNSSKSIGVGISNSGNASLFVSNQVAASLTPPTANFTEHKSEKIVIATENTVVNGPDNSSSTTKSKTESVCNALAKRDQLLRETYGPGYMPESTLATIGITAIASAGKQLLHDTVDAANAVANVHLNNHVIIHSMNDRERADAWNKNQETYANVSNAVSNVCKNPEIIPTYYNGRFKEASSVFDSSLESGNLIGAGNALGQMVYDTYVIVSTATGAAALTTKAVNSAVKTTNNFVTPNNFKPPMTFQFEGVRSNPGAPQDMVGLQNPVVPKATVVNINTEYAQGNGANASKTSFAPKSCNEGGVYNTSATKDPNIARSEEFVLKADDAYTNPLKEDIAVNAHPVQNGNYSNIEDMTAENVRRDSVSHAFKVEKIAKNTEQSLLHQFNRNVDLTIRSPSAVAIQRGWGELSPRQANLLEYLSESGKNIIIKKSDINVYDIACLTAKTGDEFAIFTLGSRRMVLRGNRQRINIPPKLCEKLKNEQWKWSAHTHAQPGDFQPSGIGKSRDPSDLTPFGDRDVLATLDQEQSLLLDSLGKRRVFTQLDGDYIDPLPKPGVKP